MFTHLIFLILALLLINTVPENVHPWITSVWGAFIGSMILYMAFCALFLMETFLFRKFLKKQLNILSILVHLQLLLYLIIYQYIFDAGRLFQLIPHMQKVQSINTLWQLFLYMGGLFIFHTFHSNAFSLINLESRFSYAFKQIKLLIPFTIPFILLTLMLDLFYQTAHLTSLSNEVIEWTALSFSLLFLFFLLIFFPYFIQKIWACTPFPEGDLKNRLTQICQKAHFKHAGMKIWTIMNDHLTAGIIGVIPNFRYVMFTERLLKALPPESIEAILAHEIGHNKYRHLLLYPFILSGMTVCAGLFFYLTSDLLLNILKTANVSYPFLWWDLLNPVIILSLYGLIFVGYFRFVFGYFSRLFERQADLHLFELGISPSHLIHALKAVAYTSGGYESPNWHHYSIKQRVEFLYACMQNPLLVRKHHRKVKIVLGIYFLLLLVASSFLFRMMYTTAN